MERSERLKEWAGRKLPPPDPPPRATPRYMSDVENACIEAGVLDVVDAVEHYGATPEKPLLDILAPAIEWEFHGVE